MQPLQSSPFHEKGFWQIFILPQIFEKSLKTRYSSHRAAHEEDNPGNPYEKCRASYGDDDRISKFRDMALSDFYFALQMIIPLNASLSDH